MKNKNMLIICLTVLCIFLAAGVGYTVWSTKKSVDNEPKQNEESNSETQSGVITVDGKKYKLNTRIRTVLFMGVDKSAKTELNNRPGENGQTDSLNLLVLDTENKKAEILQISRDSMVGIEFYDENGVKVTTEEGQIALQFAYGDGNKESCLLTSKKVSELLYGVGINSYFALTLDGIAAVTDAIGGVSLTIPEDYTWIDPAFEKGATVNLRGEIAESYVRSRNTDALDSNNQRMERQSQFMAALIDKLRGTEENSQYLSLYQEMDPYMITSMSADELLDLTEYDVSSEILKIPGEVVEREGYAQFMPDSKALQEIVLKLFYKPI